MIGSAVVEPRLLSGPERGSASVGQRLVPGLKGFGTSRRADHYPSRPAQQHSQGLLLGPKGRNVVELRSAWVPQVFYPLLSQGK